MKKIKTSALIGLGALGILFGRKMPGVQVIADEDRIARYSAERERDKQARAKAPADAEQENREHRKRHRAAVRQLPELQIAQHLRQSQQERALAQAAERHFAFCHEKHLRK